MRIVDSQQSIKRGQMHLILEVEDDDNKTAKFGVIGEKVITAFLTHGKKKNGQLFVDVPEKILKETDDGKIQWINFEY